MTTTEKLLIANLISEAGLACLVIYSHNKIVDSNFGVVFGSDRPKCYIGMKRKKEEKEYDRRMKEAYGK